MSIEVHHEDPKRRRFELSVRAEFPQSGDKEVIRALAIRQLDLALESFQAGDNELRITARITCDDPTHNHKGSKR